MKVLIKPIISEKTVKLAEELNQYTFEVFRNVSKITVAEAIEKKFSVKVLKVRTVNVLGKKVSFGKKRQTGKRSDVKKAVVTLKEGDSIDIFKLQ